MPQAAIMKITSLHLKNFKRFTDLSIQSISEQTKLVLLIGANGSGKSSVFDAFGVIDNFVKNDFDHPTLFSYFRKQQDTPSSLNINFDQGRYFAKHNDDNISANELAAQTFYCRTSFRQISRLSRTTLGQGVDPDVIEKDTDRPKYFIDKDNRFENDVERITQEILKDVFLSTRSNIDIKQKYIAPINFALQNIFGNINGTPLELIEIIPPLEGKVAQITFKKGNSEIHYNLLSAGEKEVFNLLLNLLSRREQYQDTIYVFDEIDLHLNTKLQFQLLKEITENWIPDNCQLWTASHSLGFIEYARQSEEAVTIDFDNYDFDQPRILVPEPKENPEIYEIAVGKEFLPSLFRQMNIVFVENKDRIYYAEAGIPKTVFVSGSDRNSVYHKVKTGQYTGVVDRDFLTDNDIIAIRQHHPDLYILNYYSIENYLYHPDNLLEYYTSAGRPFQKAEYIQALTICKNELKDTLATRITSTRNSYPYFGEPEFIGSPLHNRFRPKEENYTETTTIVSYLNSDDFETFYKSLPMKDNCKQLPQRQEISKTKLSQTKWFAEQIIALLQVKQEK